MLIAFEIFSQANIRQTIDGFLFFLRRISSVKSWNVDHGKWREPYTYMEWYDSANYVRIHER